MISPQDFDRLSAYLDNQLSPAEKAGLEAQLEHEPELRAALDDLRMAVRALRSLPTVKPPRNFTLSPDRARAIVRPRGVFPALRLATALAAFAFVIAVVGDFATNLAQPRLTAAPEVPVTVVAQMSAAPTETLAPPAAAQEAITVTREVSADNAGAATSSANPTADSGTPPISAFAPPVPTVAAGGGAGGEAPLQAQPTPSPSATEEAGKLAAETVTATPETEIVVPFAANGAPTPAPASPEAQTPGAFSLPPLRYIEAGLALLTLLLAIAAWLLRRR